MKLLFDVLFFYFHFLLEVGGVGGGTCVLSQRGLRREQTELHEKGQHAEISGSWGV